MGALEGRRVVVTGASSGIGAAVARASAAAFRERMHGLGLTPEHVAAAVVHVLGLPPEVCVVEYAVVSTAQQRGGARPGGD